ncbi:hypothetical protein V0R50_27210 [Pseudomonas sp. 148P]|uniref:Uncharacterized protein n=1 Tax=Pseudomonas ulcerans TaxID=3115852 RepID=A0ABU7HZP3_9PSED|nr:MULTISPECIES: hypothetical protein [unclassified Pseudomonas]MEE1925480.1 hypothetical protein [Pseudomonas sp. 147P]MEE1936928.1 hypothetical protein [Pseudomonas sp. 148P]
MTDEDIVESRYAQSFPVNGWEVLERVLAKSPELCEQAPHVAAAIRKNAAPFIQTFGG